MTITTPKAAITVARLIASGLGSGYSRFAPGTVGSVACLAVWYALVASGMITSVTCHLTLTLLTLVLGLVATSITLDNLKPDEEGPDPSFIVIDEWIGLLIALIPAVIPAVGGGLIEAFIAFALFRLFDILKPWPVNALERLPRQWGVIIDDCAAGLYALALIVLGSTLLEVGSVKAEEHSNTRRDRFYEAFSYHKPYDLSGRIAFTARVGRADKIFLLDLDVGQITPLIIESGNNRYPGWSPDGTELVFESDRDGRKTIYLSDWEGQQQRHLFSEGEQETPSWNPDGRSILFTSVIEVQRARSRGNLLVYDLKSSETRQLATLAGRNTTARWSPDGTMIAYTTDRVWPGWQVCIWNVEQKRESCPLRGREESYCRPYWSPDSSKLAFAFGEQQQIDIGLYDLKEKKQISLTRLPLREYDPVWSPDGSYIVFAAEEGKDNYNLMIVPAKGGESQHLLESRFSLRYPTWTQTTTMQLEIKRGRTME